VQPLLPLLRWLRQLSKKNSHLESNKTAPRRTAYLPSSNKITNTSRLSPTPLRDRPHGESVQRRKKSPLFLSASDASEEECVETAQDGQEEASEFDFELDRGTFDTDFSNVGAHSDDADLTPALPTSEKGSKVEVTSERVDAVEEHDWMDDELADFEEWLRSGSVNVVE